MERIARYTLPTLGFTWQSLSGGLWTGNMWVSEVIQTKGSTTLEVAPAMTVQTLLTGIDS